MALVAVDSGNIRDSVLIGTLTVNAPLPGMFYPSGSGQAANVILAY